MHTIKECFEIILTGNKEASRQAARQVSKVLYSAQDKHNKYVEIADIINSAPVEYLTILENWRQENFVMAISVIYFLHDKEQDPDFLFPWLFELLQHQNGYIRHAAVKMICNELGPLTYHIRFPNEKSTWHAFSPKKADQILCSLFISLHQLAAAQWQPKYKKYKYIDSLPVSSYKSVQMILADMADLCGIEYFNQLSALL